jgi:sec-independent protein translocase protein TatC
LICSLPIVIKEILGFVSPAFNQGKRKGQSVETSVSTKASSPSLPKIKFVKVLLPTFLLFVFGVVFSYVLVIPFTLDFLYSYGESIGAEAFLTVNDFITFVLQFILGFGCLSASNHNVCFLSNQLN